MRNSVKKNLQTEVYNALVESFKEYHRINEGAVKRKTPIFTISAMDIENDEGVDDMKYCGATYYSEEEAIEAATEFAAELASDDEPCICISVYAGEYETPNGEVYGEPQDIWTISNKSKEDTIIARRNASYVAEEVDEYAL